jgi:hypothetical protein
MAGAGAGSGGVSGASPAAGSGGAAGACGDLSTDNANCGKCGNACAAESAVTSCANASCVRACVPDRADCNGDLSLGALGDGCETHIDDEPQNCGGCNVRCDRSEAAVVTCSARKCMSFSALVGAAAPGGNVLHGADSGGQTYQQLCGSNEVLVGIDAVFDASTLYGYAGLCARLLLSGTPANMNLSLGATSAFALLGKGVKAAPPVRRLACPAGTAVTALSVATWYLPSGKEMGKDMSSKLSIKTLSLTCSALTLDAQRHVVFGATATTLTAGSSATATATFNDTCPAGAAVVGFNGRADAYINSEQTQCAALSIGYAASGSAVQAAD